MKSSVLFLAGLAAVSFGGAYFSTDLRYQGKLWFAGLVLLGCAAFVWLNP
jgi:hypothetical protein